MKNKNTLLKILLLNILVLVTNCEDVPIPNAPPTVPRLLFPTNLATQPHDTTITFSWTSSNDSDVLFWETTHDLNLDEIVYDIYLDTLTPPRHYIQIDHLDTSIEVVTVGENSTFYWQVIAIDGQRNETASEIWSFTTDSALTGAPPPVLTHPTDGATGIAKTSELQWTASMWNNPATSIPINYTVYIGLTANTLSPISTVGAGTTDFTLPATTQENTTYYWKIEATDGFANSLSTSETWSFTTEKNNCTPSPVGTPEMVFVAGGTFNIDSNEGSNDERPIHTVTLSDYSISKYEVTHTQYIDFLNEKGVAANGSYGGEEYIDMDDFRCAIGYNGSCFYFKGSSYASTANTPVIEVTWYGAAAYCEWAGGRLPTEAEWEYAARGGNQSGSYKYAGSNTIGDVAWYEDNPDLLGTDHPDYGTHSVGTKQANELGIYDMSGNVWEWCSDWYDDSYYSNSPSINPTGPASGSYRVSRGGSWHSYASICRVAFRQLLLPRLRRQRLSHCLQFKMTFIPFLSKNSLM